jgi:hypothetical protein
MQKITRTLGSRKLWAAIIGLVAALGLDVDPEWAGAIAGGVVAAYMLGTAIEDGLRGQGQGDE